MVIANRTAREAGLSCTLRRPVSRRHPTRAAFNFFLQLCLRNCEPRSSNPRPRLLLISRIGIERAMALRKIRFR